MSKRSRNEEFPLNGFEAWGGYMQAKISKLEDQFVQQTINFQNKSHIFNGISIFVNGLTSPPADELKILMAEQGGIYHTYKTPNDYVIASNLPDTKLKKKIKYNIIKPEWIVESIAANKLLDFRDYLLYKNDRRQKKLPFKKGANIKSESNNSGLHETEQSASTNIPEDDVHDIKPELNLNESVNCNPGSSWSSPRKSETLKMTAVDPNFLSGFYSNSRLHHISTLGADMKKHVNELRMNSEFIFPERVNLKKEIQKIENPGKTVQISDFKGEKVVMHIDMDCFFVSVGLRKKPELRGLPVAVTHSKGAKTDNEGFSSMSEIASCSYEARAKNLRNGMFIGAALKLCPELKTIPYDFNAYREVALQLYSIIAKYTHDIEAVSCDEMYVDCTELVREMDVDIASFASQLRYEISTATGCPCSSGFGGNRLQARLATKKAKPNGQYFLTADKVAAYFLDLPVGDLPGIGRQLRSKLATEGYTTCGSMKHLNVRQLQQIVGGKLGQKLYDALRGDDDKSLSFHNVRKSVSTDVNYGIRFENQNQCEIFLEQLCFEVHNRLTSLRLKCKSVTLKLMVRAKDAPIQTAKFMGHGICDTLNKTKSFLIATDNLDMIKSEVLKLCRMMRIEPSEMRGIGIQLSKLEQDLNVAKNKNNISTLWANLKSKQGGEKEICFKRNTSIEKSEECTIPTATVRKSYGTTRRTITRKVTETTGNSATILKQAPELKTEINPELESLQKLDIKHMKSLISAWLDTEKPLMCDVDIILAYINNLIFTKKLEKVRQLMIYLKRFPKEPLLKSKWTEVTEKQDWIPKKQT